VYVLKLSSVLVLCCVFAAVPPRAARGAVIRVPASGAHAGLAPAPRAVEAVSASASAAMAPSFFAPSLAPAPLPLTAAAVFAPAPSRASVRLAAQPALADLELPGHRLWDNWGYYDASKRVYHRFALASARELSEAVMDHSSRIHHFTSFDGRRWEDAGAFLSPGFAPQADAVWSGSAYRAPGHGSWRMYVSARRRGLGAAQSLWELKSTPSGRWGRPRLLMDAADPAFRVRAETLGYHLGEDDGIISALRDPFRDGDILYFAAKGVRGDAVRPAVGRARMVRGRVELLPPLFPPIPASWTQIELPQVVVVDGRRLMMMAVSNGGRLLGAPAASRTGQLFFRLADDGTLERLPRGDNLRGLRLPRRSGLYTANQLRDAPDGPLLLSFHTASSKRKPFTLTPPLTLSDLRKQQ